MNLTETFTVIGLNGGTDVFKTLIKALRTSLLQLTSVSGGREKGQFANRNP